MLARRRPGRGAAEREAQRNCEEDTRRYEEGTILLDW
jgi:hypothetical protein